MQGRDDGWVWGGGWGRYRVRGMVQVDRVGAMMVGIGWGWVYGDGLGGYPIPTQGALFPPHLDPL